MSTGASNRHTIQHFTHNHPLTEANVVVTYTCNGCKLYGTGKTYRCNDCDYDLHEYCATCPPILRNSWHAPDHELNMITGPAHMAERGCYVCRVYIQGMFYKCKHCSFESHPLCTHGPMHASSPDATVTRQRSLHDHAGQPSSPHHYGQGNPYGFAHMGHYGPFSHGGHPHQQGPSTYVDSGSPSASPKKVQSTPKKKNGLFGGVVKTVAGVTVAVASQLVLGTTASSFMCEEQPPLY